MASNSMGLCSNLEVGEMLRLRNGPLAARLLLAVTATAGAEAGRYNSVASETSAVAGRYNSEASEPGR